MKPSPESICISVEANYENYVNRLKSGLLKDLIGIDFLSNKFCLVVTTNMPQEFSEYTNNPRVNIFDINDVRSNMSKSLEYLPEVPVPGMYPSLYPWNLERFAIRQALNYSNSILHLDLDVECSDFQLLYDTLTLLEPGKNIYTNQGVYSYVEGQQDRFDLHPKYEKIWNFSPEKTAYTTHDGPVTFFKGESPDDIHHYIDVWDSITNYGYLKPHGFGYGGAECGNRSLCNAIMGYQVKLIKMPLRAFHKLEDRYK